MRQPKTLTMLAAVITLVFLPSALHAQADWPVYGRDSGGRRYSTLNEITPKNVTRLKLAWQYAVDPDTGTAIPPPGAGQASEATPIVVKGVLYTGTAKHTVVAIEGDTGKVLWQYDLEKAGAPRRGVSYWPGDKQNAPRIFVGTQDGRLIALNAATGQPAPGFAKEGILDLREGVTEKYPKVAYRMSSPGAIYRNLIVTGAQGMEDDPGGPYMDVRAWDVRTGKLMWTFHPLPRPGEDGADTWPKDAWIGNGSPAAWGPMAIDEVRGLAYLPMGQPAPQYYGGGRPGQNLYSSSIVALDINSGTVRWYFQLTHHDVWDYDAAVAPAFIDIVRGAKKIATVVAVSKTSMMFFLDRDTGKSIYPVEERPVPQSDTPGEKTWPTQPFSTKPGPLARLSIKPDETFTGEPEHEKFCRDLVAKIGGIHNYGPFTPYSSSEYRVIFPGQVGGVNFGGVAIDQKLGLVFVNSQDLAGLGRLDKSPEGDLVAYRRSTPLPGKGTFYSRFWDPDTRLPCQPPPWAHLTAVNANTGKIAWNVPLGTNDILDAKGMHNTGSIGQGGPIVTAGGLLFIAATGDKRFRAFDEQSGKMLWETKLDSEGHSTPLTYLGKNGRQYVVIVSSGVNAFAIE